MSKFEQSLSRIRKAIRDLAENRTDGLNGLAKVTRATDAAYRLARYESDPSAACEAVSGARVGIEEAIEAGRAIRVSALNAETKRLREEARDADRHGPTAWMRYGT